MIDDIRAWYGIITSFAILGWGLWTLYLIVRGLMDRHADRIRDGTEL